MYMLIQAYWKSLTSRWGSLAEGPGLRVLANPSFPSGPTPSENSGYQRLAAPKLKGSWITSWDGYTLNPNPQTQTLNPNPKPQIPNPKSQTPNPTP